MPVAEGLPSVLDEVTHLDIGRLGQDVSFST